MTGKPFGIERGPDGKYQQKLLPHPAGAQLQLEIRSRKTIAGYDAVITEHERQPCALKCQRCNHLISPCNPSHSIKQHNGRCTGPAQSEEELMEEDPEGPPKSARHDSSLLPLTFQHPSSSRTTTRSSCAMSLMLSSHSRSWTIPKGRAGVSWGAASMT